jgi:hypothetical protein
LLQPQCFGFFNLNLMSFERGGKIWVDRHERNVFDSKSEGRDAGGEA